jgi:hypothetical protein
MTNLRESWKRTEAHLRRANECAGDSGLEAFHGYLSHNEFELAADVLADFGDGKQGELPPAFWDALWYAYENMKLADKATLCRFRRHEAEHGFVEARLTLVKTEDGGRAHGVFLDYRPNWNTGTRTESGENELNGAPITVEGATSILPGGTGLVRLHPLRPEAWANVRPGTEIAMQEGSRVVGRAIVLRVALREKH